MGMRTTVCGYVFADSKDDSHNIQVIDSYPYDPVYPFPAAFAHPRSGYEGSTIAFAASIKATRTEWDEWRAAFERFLGQLKFTSARVTFDEEDAGTPISYAYVVTGTVSQGTRVSRWRADEGPEEGETALVL